MLCVALGGPVLGLIASIGLYFIWGLIESTHGRISAELRVRASIRASMQATDDLVLRQELLETSREKSKQAKADARKFAKWWRRIGGMVGFAFAIAIGAVSRALWFAYQAQQSAPDPQTNFSWML